MEKSHKIVKVEYEALVYSGTMPKKISHKPRGILLVKAAPNGTKTQVLEEGKASYFILLVNGIPCSFGSIGHTKDYDMTIGHTYFLKGETFSIDIMDC